MKITSSAKQPDVPPPRFAIVRFRARPLLNALAVTLFVTLMGVLVTLGTGIFEARSQQERLTALAQATGELAGCAAERQWSAPEWWRCLRWQEAFLSDYPLTPQAHIGRTASLQRLLQGDLSALTGPQAPTPADERAILSQQFAEIQRLAAYGDTLLRALLGLSVGLGSLLGGGLLALTWWRVRQATRRRLELEAHQLMTDHASLAWRSADYLPWLERLCLAVGAYNLTLWREQGERRLICHAGLGVALTDWLAPATAAHQTALVCRGRAVIVGLGVLDTPLVLVASFRGRPASEAALQTLGKLASALTGTLNRQTLLERLGQEVDLNSAMTQVSRLLAEPLEPVQLLQAALDILIGHAGLTPATPDEEGQRVWDWLAPNADAALVARNSQAAVFTTLSCQIEDETLLGVVWRLPGQRGRALFDWDGLDEGGLAALSRHIERTLGAAVVRHGLLAELQEAALWDSLTQVRNRRAFDSDLSRRVQSRRAGDRGFALTVLDLDGFKAVNDLHGHERGDALLRRFAHYLLQAIREEDTLYRLGGDEFAVVLNGARPEHVPTIEARLRAFADSLLGSPFAGVTVSVGTACFPDEADATGELLPLADQRMYEDKRSRQHLRPQRGTQGRSMRH